jgi:hypothetical protein
MVEPHMARIAQARPGANPANSREEIETTGEVFSDGTMLELVLDPDRTNEVSLLAWNGKNANVSKRFEHNGKVYVPPKLNSTVLRALRLPRDIAPYGSTRDLFNDICRVLTRYTKLSETFVWQMAYFNLGSWLVDCLSVAPFLSIIAPVGTPRAQLLRLLSCLCRRPLMLAEATPSAFACLPMHMKPTCLFDEPNWSRRAQRLLYSSNSRGRYIFRNEQITDIFSAKAVCSREPVRDALLASQALQITLSPTCQQLPFLEDADSRQIADEFQPKLLLYRLTNYGKIRTPEIDVSELTAPMQDVARALGSCFDGDKELQLGVVQLLRERDQEVRIERSTEPESAILEGLLFCSHDEGRSHVLCGELADIANTMWAKRGESQQTTPESVGWKLRALDLHSEPIGSEGKGLRLTEAVRARVHTLAQEYGVPSLWQAAKKGCPHCEGSLGIRKSG